MWFVRFKVSGRFWREGDSGGGVFRQFIGEDVGETKCKKSKFKF